MVTIEFKSSEIAKRVRSHLYDVTLDGANLSILSEFQASIGSTLSRLVFLESSVSSSSN